MTAKRSSHIDEKGHARMVDLSGKKPTARAASARALMRMKPETAALVASGTLPKGDALATARAAGILAAKKTPDLIPLCHPIALSKVDIDFEVNETLGRLIIVATAAATDRTGVEMEALTAVSIAALTIYDMCKSVQRDIEISSIVLLEKSGGKSGEYVRNNNGIS